MPPRSLAARFRPYQEQWRCRLARRFLLRSVVPRRRWQWHTRITVTLSSKGFESTERSGLVLLLCPGVELVLLVDK